MPRPLIMSKETEYALAGGLPGEAWPAVQLHRLLHDTIRATRPTLPQRQSLFLPNAGRFYFDPVDGSGKAEYAQPEVTSPRDVALYDKAGERMLVDVRRRILAASPELSLSIAKYNIDASFPDRYSWGHHSSFTCWRSLEEAAVALVPHLVGSMLFAGGGTLSAHPRSEGFELSQRSRHLVRDVGVNTTSDRAIFCTRTRKSMDARDGWVRAHLICWDHQRLPFGTYLAYGTTGLLFHHLNQGRTIGGSTRLASPTTAIRQVSLDPYGGERLNLKAGGTISAVELERRYLDECDMLARHGDEPPWGRELRHHWGETLDALERDPVSLAPRIDSYFKLAVVERERRRAGVTAVRLRTALERLGTLRGACSGQVVAAILADDAGGLGPDEEAEFRTHRKDLGDADLDDVRFAVRLQRLEHDWHELGEHGLYARLAARGGLDPVVLDDEDVARAVDAPPSDTRAAVRGACIREFHGELAECGWEYVLSHDRDIDVDMIDPFSTERRERALSTVQSVDLRTELEERMRRRLQQQTEGPW